MKISSFYSFLLSYSCPLLSYYRYSSLCFQNRSTRDKTKKRSILVWLGWAGLGWAGLGWAGLEDYRAWLLPRQIFCYF
ncbi:hypothetical protein DW155_08430 [Lactococcus petauri]|nr:hypothetical protein DW155_08430 [Lactococcus petauri]